MLQALRLPVLVLVLALNWAFGAPVAVAALEHERAARGDGPAALSVGSPATRNVAEPGGFLTASTQDLTPASLSPADVLERIERRLRAVPDYPPYLYEVKRLTDAVAVVWMDLASRQRDAYEQSYFAAIDYIEREKLALIRARRLAGNGELRAAIDLLGEAERFRKISHAFTEAAQATFASDIANGEYWAKAAYESSRAAALFAGAAFGPSGMQAVDAMFLATDFFVDWPQHGIEQAAANTFSRAATKLLLTQVPLPTLQAEAGHALAASFNQHFAGKTFEAALADGSTTILRGAVAPYIAAALLAPATRERLLALLLGGVEHTLEKNLIGPALDAAFAGYMATLTGQPTAEPATGFATQAAAAGLRPAQQALAQEILDAFDGDIETIRLVARHAEHAWLAAAAYGDERGQPYQRDSSLPLPGWTVADAFLIENRFTGDFSATLFEHADGRVVLAFRGTAQGRDWIDSLVSWTPIPTSQIVQAEVIAESLASRYPEIVFVGHSLGGRLANVARVKTGKNAVVFDTAPHSPRELKRHFGAGGYIAFRSPGDPISISTAIADIEVANFHRYDNVSVLFRTGFEQVLRLSHNHRSDHLAAAMRVVEIALPWIEQALGTAVAESAAPESPSLEGACAAGDAAGCNDLGLLYRDGEGVEKDLARAAELFQQACSGGSARGCNRLGLLYAAGKGVDRDFEKAAALYQQACDGGEPWGCNNLSLRYFDGKGVEKDVARGVAFAQQACDDGIARSCLDLAFRFENGRDVEKNLLRAAALFEQACAADLAGGCVLAATHFRLAPPGEGQDVGKANALNQRAVELFQRSCEAGNAEHCGFFADFFRDGDVVTQDLLLAARFYGDACEGGDARSCNELGIAHANGRGVERDLARATELFRKACEDGYERACSKQQELSQAVGSTGTLQTACDGGDAASCAELGSIYRDGEGVEKDRKRAAGLFEQACDGGSAEGCHQLGALYFYGRGVDADFAQASDLWRRACETGHSLSCIRLAGNYRSGRGVGLNRSVAVELYRRGCDRDHAELCVRLGDTYRDGQSLLPQDLALASELYGLACAVGSEAACESRTALAAAGDGDAADRCRVTLAPNFASSFRWARGPDLGESPRLEWDGACNGLGGRPSGEGKVTAYAPDGTILWYWLVGPHTGFTIAGGELNAVRVPRSYSGLDCRSPAYFGNGKIFVEIDEKVDLAGKIHFQRLLLDGVNHLLEQCANENPGMSKFDVRFKGFPVSGLHLTGSGLTRTGDTSYSFWNEANPLDRERAKEVRSFNEPLLKRIAQAEQARRQEQLAARKEQLLRERGERVDAWLLPSGVIENVADALEHDRQRTLVQLAAGHRMRIKVSPAEFADGRFVIQQRFGATDLDQAAGDTAFSWDRWFEMTQNPSRGIWTVYCRFTPDQAGNLQEGESIVVEAKLVATNESFGNNMVVDCAR